MLEERVLVDYDVIVEQMRKLAEENKELKQTVAQLQAVVLYERSLREEAESSVEKKKKLTKDERMAINREKQERRLLGVKSDGKSIVQLGGSKSIESYDEFLQMSEILRNGGKYGERDYLAFMLQILTGLRVIEIFSFKWEYFFTPDLTYRDRAFIVERKTAKISQPLITEGIRYYIDRYLEITGTAPVLGEYIFKSQKKTTSPEEMAKSFSKKIKDASIECGRIANQNHITSHGLRKTFARIVECCYKSNADYERLCVISLSLNHSSVSTTKAYLSVFQEEKDKAQQVVSDFCLGRLPVKLDKPAPKDEDLESKINEVYEMCKEFMKVEDNEDE